MKYVQDEGEWFEVNLEGVIRQQCCSCGLVHDIEFCKKGRKIEMRFVRNQRATKAVRRSKKKHIAIGDDD